MRTIDRVRRGLNQNLALQGVVLTMFDRAQNLCEMVAADVRSYLGDRVYKTMIPRNVRVSEAPSHGKPVLLYDLRCAGSQAYVRLAREILQRRAEEHTAELQSLMRISYAVFRLKKITRHLFHLIK